MEQDKKYYTPDPSELYIGYECEKRHHYIGGNPYWEKTILKQEEIGTEIGIIYNVIDIGGTLRTPYLCKEDIEGSGWVFKETIKEGIWGQINDVYELNTSDRAKGYMDGYETLYTMKLPCVIPFFGENLYGKVPENVSIYRVKTGGFAGGTEKGNVFKGTIKSKNELSRLMQWIGIK